MSKELATSDTNITYCFLPTTSTKLQISKLYMKIQSCSYYARTVERDFWTEAKSVNYVFSKRNMFFKWDEATKCASN